MITTGFDKKVKIQQIIDNQLPEFVLSESPKAVDFLKQYYISQEYQGGPVDITDNLDEYLDNGGDINDLLDDKLASLYKTSETISPEAHVNMQIVWQKYVDSGISKTINFYFNKV